MGPHPRQSHNQDACAVAYADDGCSKAKLSVALEVLSDIKLVLKEDAGLDINDKTKILVKGITAAEAHAAAQRLLAADPSLAHLGPLLTPKTFVDNGYIGLGVPIGTDAFIQDFVKEKCEEIMEDVDKLDNILDCFIQYPLIRFCQATRLQYLNGQVQLANQQVLQQQHVDHKIANALLKKGTREAYKKWHLQDRAWVDMRLHESHDEGGLQHYLEARGSIHNQRPVRGFPGHFRPPCSGSMAAGQRHPGSHHLERPFPSHAQAPA